METKIAEWKTEMYRYFKGKKYAESTKKIYWCAIECFIWHFKTVSLDRMHWHKVADYILQYDSSRTIEQKKYAIQLFYGICLGQGQKLAQMPNPKREKIIPEVLNVQEVRRVIMCAGSWSKTRLIELKQRCAIQFTYDCALRISETENAKIKHIDFDRNFFFVHQSKGAKDRVVMFTDDTKELLLQYLAERFPNGYTGEEYLFDGQDNFYGQKCEQYSAGSLRAILKRALREAQIHKKIKFHSLRHSKATHLHNSGVMSLRDLADFLGHSDTKTTEIYLHTQNEDLREKYLKASAITQEKFTTQIPQPAVVLLKKVPQKNILPAAHTYSVSLNGSEFQIIESDDHITTAPPNHQWAVNKESETVLAWFKRKGFAVTSIASN